MHDLSRRKVLLGLGGIGGVLALMGNNSGCVPDVPLPVSVTDTIATTCAWVPTVAVGVEVAATFLSPVVAAAANAAMTYLTNLCASPPANLADVSQQIIDAVTTVQNALTSAKAAMSKPGARRGLHRGDLDKVNNALDAIRRGKRAWHIQ